MYIIDPCHAIADRAPLTQDSTVEQNKQISMIESLKSQIDSGVNFDTGQVLRVPTSHYYDEDIAAREWTTLFQDTPQIVGLSADLPENGSTLTADHLGAPILCTRGTDGKFRAFLNVCRHRGHILVDEKRTSRRLLTCPFHAWSYDLNGKLVAVPKESEFGSIDKSCHGLIELSAAEECGLLIVVPNPDKTLNVNEFLGPLSDELAAWKIEQSVHVSDTVWETDCNWKSAVDTFGETYHFPALHSETVAQVFFGNHAWYEFYDKHHLMFFGKFELNDIVKLPKSEWRIVNAGIPVYHLHPNTQLAFIGGAVVLIRIYPLQNDPMKSLSYVSYYYHNDRLADVGEKPGEHDLVVEIARLFGAVIQGEDYPAAESSSKGSAAMTNGHVLLGRNEGNVQHFHEVWAKAMKVAPPEIA